MTATKPAPGHRPAPQPPASVPPVVTGIGVAAPNGFGREEWWRATLRGESGIRPISRFDAGQYPARLAGEVQDFDPADHIPGRLMPQTDHVTRLALAVADEALADARVDPAALPDYAAGVVTASSAGGFEFGQRELQALWSQGRQYVSAYQSFAWFYAVNTGQISIRHGLRGPSGVLVTEQAGGLDAVAQARRQLRKGIRLVVTGGVESALCPWGWAAQLADGRLSTVDDPDRAYLPFTADARGHVAGEGGALLIVEDATAARERGAETYGTIAGYAATFDPAPGGAVRGGREPAPGGMARGAGDLASGGAALASGGAAQIAGDRSRLRDAAELALWDAGLTPADVDVVFADAAGDIAADLAEARAVATLFGPNAVPVTAPKTMTGRLSAGAASLDLAAALLALRDQVIPPTVNVGGPAPGLPIDLVTEQRPAALRTALVLARGRGGFNAAMVVRVPG
ncbi:ketosynthase chain-length factor [Streptomyces sp. TRM68416]|uniref:ketosynthase chain-length factor n=1 Tax=Streptomyces sp. TRM68416 TaxID=2758412 RepID=UPI0016620790|nr:ketosynthase chain-length factor [Streptomyces sp. TRM68416]MBD0838360.1 ketosynthase chain-length factor [Streptomyces sp. TRM68416]